MILRFCFIAEHLWTSLEVFNIDLGRHSRVHKNNLLNASYQRSNSFGGSISVESETIETPANEFRVDQRKSVTVSRDFLDPSLFIRREPLYPFLELH